MFKRLLVLAVALALFVAAFFIHFQIADAQIENGFRQERDKFHVADMVLTAPDCSLPPAPDGSLPPAPAAPTAASTVGAAPAAMPVAPISTSGSGTPSAPIAPNNLIGPVPPPDTTAPASGGATPDGSSTPGGTPSPTPDNSAAPAAPATPATPAAPATDTPAAPSSTFVYPGLNRLPFVVLAAYDSQGMRIQSPTATSAVPAVASTPAPAIETPSNSMAAPSPNSGSASTKMESAPTSTNATPAAAAARVTAHGPVPVAASVIVLGYHQFTGPGVPSKNIYSMRQDVFDQEMKYLKDNNYHVVPLADVVRFVKHEIGLQPNTVAVTIDDGYKSAINWAAPVLKKYNFPWTFFVYPDFITVAEGKGAASWNDLLQLQSAGVDIECHSKSHPIMTKKGGKTPEQYDAWLTAETAGAKATLEQHLGKPVKFFAYPYGAYNKEVEAKVIQAGFEAIFTVANNPVHPTTNPYSIGRYIITTPVEKAFASYLRQGALGVADATPAPGATISDPRPVISAVIGYAGTLDPSTISTDVRDYGEVRHDFDPKTSTVRLYLPRDLIDSVVVVNIRAKDAGQTMIASWRFNYAPTAPTAAHPPIPSAVPPASASPSAQAVPSTRVQLQPATAAITPVAAPAADQSSNEAPIPSTNNSASTVSAPVEK